MRSHFELSPAEYEAQRQGHLQRRRVDLILADVRRISPRPGELIVELGCGPGDVLAAVAAACPSVECLGLDIDPAMVEYAQEAHGGPTIEFRAVDLARQPLDLRARFVFGIDVLHHVGELSRFVGAVGDLLAAGGLWTVVEPNSRNPYIWLHQERMRRGGLDEDHFRPKSFEVDARRNALTVVSRSTAFLIPGSVRAVPSPLARLERLLERIPEIGGSVIYRLTPA